MHIALFLSDFGDRFYPTGTRHFVTISHYLDDKLHPRLISPMTVSERARFPASGGFAYILCNRLVSDGIAEFCSDDDVDGLGFLSLTPEILKNRFRILTDTLFINARSTPPKYPPVSFRSLEHLRGCIQLEGYSFGATYDLEKSFFQIPLSEHMKRLCAFRVLYPGNIVRTARMCRLAMGYIRAVDAMHCILHVLSLEALSTILRVFPFSRSIIDPYVDGVLLLCHSLQEFTAFDNEFRRLCFRYGITIGDTSSGSLVTHRGVQIDLKLRTWTLKPTFCKKFTSNCQALVQSKTATLRQIDSIAGQIEYIDSAMSNGCAAKPLHNTISWLIRARHSSAASHVVPHAIYTDLHDAAQMTIQPRSLVPMFLRVFTSVSDASDVGWSLALIFSDTVSRWIFVVRQNWDDLFPTTLFSDAPVATWHINIRELWPIAVSRILLNLLNVPHEHWHIGDNSVSLAVAANRYSRSECLHKATDYTLRLSRAKLRTFWTPSAHMWMDEASRTQHFDHRSIIDHAKSIPLPIVLGEAT
jgi:hypothetical protein